MFMLVIQDESVDPHYLLGVLNSAPLRAYWLDRFYDQRTTFPKIKGTYLKKLPLPTTPDEAGQKEIASVVLELIRLIEELGRATSDSDSRRLQRGIAGQEGQLDARVAALYGLSKEQQKLIERVAAL